MNIRALLFCGLLAGCSSLSPMGAQEVGAQEVGAQEVDPESYAAADIAAIQKEADDLDIDQLAERMDAMRDGVWQNKAPTPPTGAAISIELHQSSGFSRFDGSLLLWRDAAGKWEWHRATHDGMAPEAQMFKTSSGAIDPAQASKLDAMLSSPERRAEVWYSPAATPLKGTDETNTCFDGASSLLLIRRMGKPDEFVVQSCRTRWLNGDLINLISSIGRG